MRSGRFVVRISPLLHQALIEEARGRGISLNDICLERLSMGVSPKADARVDFLKLTLEFFNNHLLGVIDLEDKYLVFLKNDFIVNALLYWDFEEQVLEKLPFSKKVNFINLTNDFKKISTEVKQSVLVGKILYDRENLLNDLSFKLKSAVAASAISAI